MTVSTFEACIAYGILMIGIASMFGVTYLAIKEFLMNSNEE